MTQLLFEIGTEEIPAGYLKPALAFMEKSICERFTGLGLAFGKVQTVATPRRLTLAVDDLQERQEDSRQQHIGPAKKAAFDGDGNPTKAAMGFARSKGIAVEDLQVVDTPKGDYLMAVEEVKGRETLELLPELLNELLRSIPFAKSMHWADSSLTFARPIQWLLALYNGKVIEFAIEQVQAGNTTPGHRFMSPKAVPVQDYEQYLKVLAEKSVIADIATRRAMVVDEVEKAVAARIGSKGKAVLDQPLIDTVTNLVEIPFAVCGSFDEKFLALPDEALITSMREHQKYFPVVDKDNGLLPLFVAVNNTDIEDKELAANGHQRVLRARLEDGLFFFNEDKKRTLSSRMADLTGIIFQHKLGSMAEKSERIAVLAGWLAHQLAPELQEDAVRAARLAKVDLLTEMVGEFPSLQGIIGRDYALLDGEKPAVATAIHEHYLPVRANGSLPESMIGALVGLADRMDSMVGYFAINERPTGNKDAFGQRRLAIGLINIILGLDLSLSLGQLAEKALAGYELEAKEDTLAQLLAFIRLRFENDQIAGGQQQEVVEAATSVGCDDLTDCLQRIQALNGMRNSDGFAVLAGSFKRIRNITKDYQPDSTEINTQLLEHDVEKELYTTFSMVAQQVLPLVEQGAYSEALTTMLTMKDPVDRFFDEVMVMAEDPAVRANRLKLLSALGTLVRQVGDISRMHVS